MGTPGSRRCFRPRARRLTVSGPVRLAVARSREAEILQRFAFLLAALENIVPLAQRYAARQALLLDQTRSLAAIRALARAERQAAEAVTVRHRTTPGRPRPARIRVSVRRRRSRRSRRGRLHRVPHPYLGG